MTGPFKLHEDHCTKIRHPTSKFDCYVMQNAYPAIEMDADVGAHVLRADLQYAVLVDPARVRPLGDDVVDDALAQVLRHRVLGGVSRVIYRSRVAYIVQVWICLWQDNANAMEF